MAVPTLFGASLLVFFIFNSLPGDVAVAILGRETTHETIELLREHLNLNDPWYQRYGRWVGEMATFGDFGQSLFRSGWTVKELIRAHLPVTLNLAIYTMVLGIVAGIPLGALSAIYHNRPVDYVLRVLSVTGLSIPAFWAGLMILLILLTFFRWRPELIWVSPFDSPWGNLKQMIWPVLALGYFQVAFLSRMTRSALLEVLRQDYMKTARAKGLSEWMVMARHGLRNALIPVVTIASLLLVQLLGGVVVTEKVFNLPGIGSLVIKASFSRDFPVIQTVIFFFALLIIIANLITDLLYAWLDPRIRYE